MARRSRPSEIPPPLELDCLKALWQLGSGSVKDVRRVLAAERDLAYTTILTVLERLSRRGAVERKKNGRAFIYEPRLHRDDARHLAVRQLIDTYFGGSTDALRSYLAQASDGATAELRPAANDTDTAGLDTSLL
jgi:predicted transcriptional regulator